MTIKIDEANSKVGSNQTDESLFITKINEYADYWFHQIGANVIPADTKNKNIIEEWKKYQSNTIPDEIHNERKSSGAYSKGIAIILGQLWRGSNKGFFINGLDCDNRLAIEELLQAMGKDSIEDLAKWTIIENHKDDLNKLHIYILSRRPFKSKSSSNVSSEMSKKLSENKIPAIEVKSDGKLLFCSPSIHKNGYRYEILGTKIPSIQDDFEKYIDEILIKYGINYLSYNHKSPSPGNEDNLVPIRYLFKKNFRIFEGHNRHEALLRVIESLLQRLGEILSEDEIKRYAEDWNCNHCFPPLDKPSFEIQWKDAKKFIQSNNYSGCETLRNETNTRKNTATILIEIAEEMIDEYFKDQYGEGFARIIVNDEDNNSNYHHEVMPINSRRFERFLSKSYYEKFDGHVLNKEAISNAVQILLAKAEFGKTRHPLFLRVAEFEGDFFYDLTNEKHQAIRISKEGIWEIVGKTPVPLFRRYNQISQDLPFEGSLSTFEGEKDPLEYFVSSFTNIQDEQTKLLIKVILISYFIPNIPHIILMVYGGKGSAKTTFQSFIKQIVDPAKPSLLTIHDSKSEFIQQLAHNYVGAYDNMKFIPRWLSDEACKAVTGIGQTKRTLFTDDDDKIYEYKLVLLFNGINLSFSEPDVIDRSVIVELPEIKEEQRKTEKEIVEEFLKLKPKILRYVFDILAKSLTLRKEVSLNRLPRMADFAMFGEAISHAMGNTKHEFLKAYYDNIKFQNSEVIDSNLVALAIKKIVEINEVNHENSNSTIFDGPPVQLLRMLENAACELKLNTTAKDWPKDPRWLVRRINIIKSNLQQVLDISIKIERDSRNTSTIKIEKNMSYNSAESKITPVETGLSPYLNGISPDDIKMNPNTIHDLDIRLIDPGNIGDIGDNNDDNEWGKENTNNSDSMNPSKKLSLSILPIVTNYFECYYCNDFPSTDNEHDYRRHVVLEHPGKPAYPSLADLNKNDIPPKGKKWEA